VGFFGGGSCLKFEGILFLRYYKINLARRNSFFV
jgi:hypothetical protein